VPAWVVIEGQIVDPEQYVRTYVPPATASVEKYRRTTLLRGVNGRALEGAWAPDGLVVIEFESADAAMTWFHSGEYQAAKKLREGVATFRMTLVEAPPARAGQGRPS
jgi:uncharacterized protein (DUF1330 family)